MGWTHLMSSATGITLRLRTAIVATALLLAPSLGVAQERKPAAPQFDYYVLSLSWSTLTKSFYAYGFSLQSESGSSPSQLCRRDRAWPPPARTFVQSMQDLLSGARNVHDLWQRHGHCSGFAAEVYFDAVRKASAVVKTPEDFARSQLVRRATGADIEAAFRKANAGLAPEAITTICDGISLAQVRICLDKDFRFRACSAIDARRPCGSGNFWRPLIPPAPRL